MAGQEDGVAPVSTIQTAEVTDAASHGASDGPIDEAAFAELFTDTYQPLVAYARRRSADWSEADDVVSEVFVIAWRRRAELDPAVSVLPWLYGIAGNVLRNQWRSSGRRLKLVDRLESQPDLPAQNDPADRPGAELREALTHLSFDDQEVLRLVAWEGLGHAEIGQILDCSTNAVGIRIHRARQRLNDALTSTETPTPLHEKDPS